MDTDYSELNTYERSIEELNLTEAELGELEEVREQVWKEEKKSLGL